MGSHCGLVFHSIPTWGNAIAVRAKAHLYTPKEHKWMEANISQIPEAKIIEHSVSLWSYWTKFVPKKYGDVCMVHLYSPINAVSILNTYPMKRIEPVLNNVLQSGLSVYFQADTANGYWVVQLVPEHILKTAIDTHMGQCFRSPCDKVCTICKYPTPANYDELKAFLHLTTYVQ